VGTDAIYGICSVSYLVLARHGKVPAYDGDPEKVQGWRNDPGDHMAGTYLTKIGTDKQLAQLDPKHIITSDLHRALVSALTILRRVRADGEDATVEPSDKLRPWKMGEFEGHVRDRVEAQIVYYLSHPDAKIIDGESFDTFKQRWLPMFARLNHVASMIDRPLIAITHSWNVKLADAWIKAGSPTDMTYDRALMEAPAELEPGEWAIYSTDPKTGKVTRSTKHGVSSKTSSTPGKPSSPAANSTSPMIAAS